MPEPDYLAPNSKNAQSNMWVTFQISDYQNSPLVHETNRYFIDCYLKSRERGVTITGIPLYSSVMKKPQLIYSLSFQDEPVIGGRSSASAREDSDSINNRCDEGSKYSGVGNSETSDGVCSSSSSASASKESAESNKTDDKSKRIKRNGSSTEKSS